MKTTEAYVFASRIIALSASADAATVCTPDPQLPSPCTDQSLSVYTPQNTFPADLDEEVIFLDDLDGVTTVTGNVGSQDSLPEVQFVTDVAVDSASGNATITPMQQHGKRCPTHHPYTAPRPGHVAGFVVPGGCEPLRVS